MIIDKLILSPKEILTEFNKRAKEQKQLLLTYFNQNSFNIYHQNKRYKELLDGYFKVYQADSGIYFFLRFIKKKKITRIDATSMNEEILKEIVKQNLSISFIGGSFSEGFISEESKKRKINFAGYYHGYFKEDQIPSVVELVKQFNSQIYFIGMGVPKQELFANRLWENSRNKIIICVGNFLEFYFGTKKRAPLVFRRLGIEWLFRLYTEPGRLWKRYMIGIPEFFFRIIKEFRLIQSDNQK
jgi:N-acetylglucosaminyldiphosphoundecaprenol N-acetyl-beta-D-mannosaminyltransferase